MKLQFKGTVNFPAYHSEKADFVDGESKEVSDEVGEYLLTGFPGYFTEVKAQTREMLSPVKDKMMRKVKTRKL